MISNNGKDKLKAGTYVKVNVNMTSNEKVLMIPRDAIISSLKDPSVYLVRDNMAQLTKIDVGRNYESYIEIVSGLKEGDRVVTNGQINLTGNSKITVIK